MVFLIILIRSLTIERKRAKKMAKKDFFEKVIEKQNWFWINYDKTLQEKIFIDENIASPNGLGIGRYWTYEERPHCDGRIIKRTETRSSLDLKYELIGFGTGGKIKDLVVVFMPDLTLAFAIPVELKNGWPSYDFYRSRKISRGKHGDIVNIFSPCWLNL